MAKSSKKYESTPRENWAPREKPKESYAESIRQSKQEWRDTGGKSYSRKQIEGKIPTTQRTGTLKAVNPLDQIDDYLSSDKHSSEKTGTYLDAVNQALNDPNTSDRDYYKAKTYQQQLEMQRKKDLRHEKWMGSPLKKAVDKVTDFFEPTPEEKVAMSKGELEMERDVLLDQIANAAKNTDTGAWQARVDEINHKLERYGETKAEAQAPTGLSPKAAAKQRAESTEGKLAQARMDLSQMEWVYNGSDISEEDKAKLEDRIAAKKTEIKALEGGGWEQDRHRGQAESIPAVDLLLGRRTSGEERAEAQAPAGGKAKEPKPAEPEKPPEEMDREELVDQYQAASNDADLYAGYATDPLTEAALAPTLEKREELEEEIQKRNKEEGLDVYTDLAGNTAAADAAESFIGERQAGTLSALGAALGGIDANIGYASEDEKTLNLQWIQAHAKAMASGDPADWAEADRLEGELEALQEQNKGKRHGLLGKLADLFLGSSEDLRETANEQWSDFTADMGGGEKFAWEIAKGSANLGFDMVDNVIVPGSGTMRMFLGAAGGEVQGLADKGIDDPDALFLTAVKGGANAWLSNKLLGGVEAAYGKSVLGGLTEKAFAKASPAVQRAAKVLLNSEGVEEGLEDVLNWAGDIVLGLDEESRLSFDEVKQDALVGYILGVLTNGLAGGIEYDAAKRQALAQEAVDFAMSGMTLEEAVQKAKSDTVDQVVMKANPQADENGRFRPDQNTNENVNENVDTNMQEEQAAPAENRAEENAPETAGRLPTKWHDLQNIVEQSDNAAIQASGTGQYMVYKRGEPKAFRVFNDLEEARAYYNQVDKQSLLATRMENDEVSEDEYLELLRTKKGREQLAEALGIEQTDQRSVTAGVALYLMGKDQQTAQAELRAEEQAPTAEQMLLGEEETPSEPQNEPVENAAPEQGNIPPNTENSTVEGLTEPETNGEQNAGETPPGNNLAEGGNDQTAPGTGKEKVSQYFTNTLTKREGDSVGDPLKYLTKTEKETLQNAVNRLQMNGDAEMQTMLATTMWSDEQVKMAKIIGTNLFNDSEASGDKAAYNAWRKIEREHATAIARALRAMGQDPDVELNAEMVQRMSERFLSLVEDGAVPEAGNITQDQIDSIRASVEQDTSALAKLESEESDLIKSGMNPDEAFAKVKDRYLDMAQRLVAQRNVGTLWDNALGRNKNLRNGAEDVSTRLRKMLAKEDADYIKRYVQSNIAGKSADLKYMGGISADKVGKWVSSMQKLCQLFGSSTTLRNLEGNAGSGLLATLSNDTAGVAADQLLSLFTGNRTRGIELGVLRGGNWKAAGKAARRSILEIAANMDMDGKYIGAGASAFNPYNTVDRMFNRANQILSYALNTSDALFVGMTQESAADAALKANQNRGGKMTEETAQKIGEAEAEYQTFKNDTSVQKVIEGARDFLDLIGVGGKITRKGGVPVGRSGGFGLGTAAVPYIQVPVNIALKGVEYSPVGAVKGAVDAGKAIKASKNASPESKAGQEAMIQQAKAAGEIGRGITGTALVLALTALMKKAKEEDREWFKDWTLEEDSNVKAQNRAEGKSGMQINADRFRKLIHGEPFGGKWENGEELVNIASIEPLNQYLGLASMLADDDGELSAEDYFNALYESGKASLEDLSAISSINQFANTYKYNPVYDTTVTEDAEGNITEERELNTGKTTAMAAGAMAGNMASGFIPAPLRHAAQVSDEYQRETRGDNALETAWNQVLNSLPWARETLPVKLDAFGKPVTQGDTETRVRSTYGPNRVTQVNQSDTSREIEEIRDETGTSLMPARLGPASVKIGDRMIHPDVSERMDWGEQAGSGLDWAVELSLRNPDYQNADYDTRAELIKEQKKYITDEVKSTYAKANRMDYDRKYEYLDDVDSPIKWLTTKKLFDLSNKNGEYDVIDSLLGTIRKMDADERDLMLEKDNALKGYYDFLTPNDEGYKVKDAATVNAMKEGKKAQGEKRGVGTAGAIDELAELREGFRARRYTAEDVDAFMSQKQSDGDYTMSKGRYAIYSAIRKAYPKMDVGEILDIVANADVNENGLKEGPVRVKGEYEVSGAIKSAADSYEALNEMMDEFERIYYKKGE